MRMCELPDLFECREVIGRKSYHCCECFKLIERGERHQHIKGLWEGEWSSFRTCFDCCDLRARIDLAWEDEECGVALGHVYEYVTDLTPDAFVWLEQRKANREKKNAR